jgi:hypothetical protein
VKHCNKECLELENLHFISFHSQMKGYWWRKDVKAINKQNCHMRREQNHEVDDVIRSCGSIGSRKLFVPTSLIDKEGPLAGCQLHQQPVM